MSLFSRQRSPSTDATTLQRIKDWTKTSLNLDEGSVVSISQLRCHEPDCPPVETVIAVMTHPPQTYKIHKAASDIEYDDVVQAIQP
ncbi:MAG: hypothetical protein VKJ64_06110 [Leptolyngbyaceae bacterium]|nr:hypothetical protein [Leptolyngbyaceae bacterium]